MHHQTKSSTYNFQSAPDPRALRDAFGAFATGITITTTLTDAAEPVGFTASSFTSVSLDPALVLVCIAESAFGYAAFRSANRFCVNVLADHQRDVSNIFASRGAEKFASVAWRRGATGAPVLSGVAAYFDCLPHQWADAGDHGILIGRVVDFQSRDAVPLCYHRGRYSALETPRSLPQTAGVQS